MKAKMSKKHTPKILIEYTLKEFLKSLLIFTLIFLSLILMTSYVEEIIFFKEKEINQNFFLVTFVLTLIKIPNLIINISPIIFLFSGIFFYIKMLRSYEVTPFNFAGLSNNFIILVPATLSAFIGIILILVISPISAELSKYYEIAKQKYSNNENLLIISNTGLWLKEKNNNKEFIIRADGVKDDNFSNLKNVTIYVFDENKKSFYERIDAKTTKISDYKWTMIEVKKTNINKQEVLTSYQYESNINLNELKKIFINSSIFSIWDIGKKLKNIRERGYYGQELIIKFNKLLSLPFLLFSMICISTFFTLNLKTRFNNFVYIFFGIVVGIAVHFLSDLSIAIGKNGQIPLIVSIWIPTIIILILSIYSLIRNYE